MKIVDSMEFEPLNPADAVILIDRMTLTPQQAEPLAPEHVIVGKRGARHHVNRNHLQSALENPASNLLFLCSAYLAYNTLTLNGQNRIQLARQQPSGDLQNPAQTSFQVLFRDDEKRAEARRIIHDAFGLYLVIDPTSMGQLRLRLSSRPPIDAIEERGIHAEAVRFHAQAQLIDHASDGVKAFTGMITEIIAGDPIIITVDEPEAFLHPSLAFSLGKEISLASVRASKRVFASTHSPNFLMGCIQSGSPVTIIRLTYRGDVATARVLRTEDVLRLMRNPLLRSTNVLSGLFYEFVVVAESDTDRAFYQEINDRLLNHAPEMGIPNCLFLNAQNKQTVQTIIRPLRELGIPTAGIVDIDILKDGGKSWTGFLDCGGVPNLEHQPLGCLRHHVAQRLSQGGKNMKKDGGIDILSGSDREAAMNLFERLKDYGLFVVPRGELESWLKGTSVSGHGPAWLVQVFERMGEDPNRASYMRPGDGDVWGFVAEVKHWLADPLRKGIPA